MRFHSVISMAGKVCLGSVLSAAVVLPLSAADQQPAAPASKSSNRSMADLLKTAGADDWRSPDPENLLYLELAGGRVIMELAPKFAPLATANIKKLVRENYFDGLAVVRSQDNFVVQWADPNENREIKTAAQRVPGEFSVAINPAMHFTRLPDADGYAPQVGHVDGFAVGRDVRAGQTWLAHCYGAIGVSRDNASDSGNGSSLYVVTGQSPRQLDRNITVVGKVLQGMELLSTLPRGTGPLGFYEKPEQNVPIQSIRVAADLPSEQRTALQVLRTDGALYQQILAAQRNRGGDWYKRPAGYLDLCNAPVPVRKTPA